MICLEAWSENPLADHRPTVQREKIDPDAVTQVDDVPQTLQASCYETPPVRVFWSRVDRRVAAAKTATRAGAA